jgi:hypothetical protein
MLLYNITFGIDKEVETEWLSYMRSEHVPAVMKTGLFMEYKFFKVLHDENDGTISYSVQYFANTLDDVVRYLESFAPTVMEHHRQRFPNRHAAFQTLLEEV